MNNFRAVKMVFSSYAETSSKPRPIAQADPRPAGDQENAGLMLRSGTFFFVEIDHENIMVILSLLLIQEEKLISYFAKECAHIIG